MYILRGQYNGHNVYFQKFLNVTFEGSDYQARYCSEVIEGARWFSENELGEAKELCQELNNEFKIYPVCPRCNHEYEEPPAISRKDNKTKICSKCGTNEALHAFINYSKIPN